MSQPAPPRPAKLVIGLFLQDKDLIAPVVEDLRSLWGDLDQVSAWIPFDFTSYYASEMGEPLFRRVMTFEGLIQQSTLASIKQETNTIEAAYARAGRRSVSSRSDALRVFLARTAGSFPALCLPELARTPRAYRHHSAPFQT